MNKVDAGFFCGFLFLVWLFLLYLLPQPILNFVYMIIAAWSVGAFIGRKYAAMTGYSDKAIIQMLYQGSKRLFTLLDDQQKIILQQQGQLHYQQSQIDALMLEYCPDEMTPEQRAEWGINQVPGELH